MSLRDQAAADLQRLIEDDSDFAWPVSVVSPWGQSESLKGYSNDIGQELDPETQVAVAGRTASVALSMKTLRSSFGQLPVGVTDETRKPWVVCFTDVEGNERTYKVSQAMPDATLGTVLCMLEAYTP